MNTFSCFIVKNKMKIQYISIWCQVIRCLINACSNSYSKVDIPKMLDFFIDITLICKIWWTSFSTNS